MHRLLGLVLAGGLVLGHAHDANAQFSLSIGNPYTGSGVTIGSPYYGGYGYGGYGGYGYPYGGGYGSTYSSYYGPGAIGTYVAPLYGATTYSSGYSGYIAPGTTYYNSGYYGAYPRGSFYSPAYSGYGYGGYGPSSVWMGTSPPSSVWMGGLGRGWRGGGRYSRW